MITISVPSFVWAVLVRPPLVVDWRIPQRTPQGDGVHEISRTAVRLPRSVVGVINPLALPTTYRAVIGQ